MADIERLSREASEFEVEAREQEARLGSIGLIADAGEDGGDICPLCDSQLSVSVPTVAEIRDSLATVQTQLRSVRRDAPRLQERLAGLASRRDDLNEQIRDVQGDIAKRVQDNERLRLEQHQFAEQARVAGRIAYYLENAAVVADDGELRASLSSFAPKSRNWKLSLMMTRHRSG